MFTAKERRIFRHPAPGGGEVSRDPLRADRRLENGRPSNYEELCRALDVKREDGTPKPADEYFRAAGPALDVLIPYFCKAFEVPPFDNATGEGWTEEEVIDLHNAFQTWKQKKSEGSGASGSPSSPSTQAPTPSPGESQPSPASTDCGCGEA